MVTAAEALAELGVRLQRRADRQHHHRRGVHRRRRPRVGADAARRRGDRPRAQRPGRVGRLPRLAAADGDRRGPRRPRRASRPGTPSDGGAVNAIEKTALPAGRGAPPARGVGAAPAPTPFLSAADCVPTMIAGGEWMVSYPARCRLDCHIEYLPGPGRRARRRRARASASSRRGSRPPRPPTRGCASIRRGWSGWSAACRRPRCRPTSRSCAGAAGDRARPRPPGARSAGLDNWHDGAMLTVEGGHPVGLLRPGRRPRSPTPSRSTCRSPTSSPARRASRSRRCASRGSHDGRQRVHRRTSCPVPRLTPAEASAIAAEHVRGARRGARAGQPAGPELPPRRRPPGRFVLKISNPAFARRGARPPEPGDGARGGAAAGASCRSPVPGVDGTRDRPRRRARRAPRHLPRGRRAARVRLPRPGRAARRGRAGRAASRRALADFDHPAADRVLQWDVRPARPRSWPRSPRGSRDAARRALLERTMERAAARARAARRRTCAGR